jgi:hypothetical protein
MPGISSAHVLSAVALFVALTAVLTGCGGSGDDQSATTTSTTASTTSSTASPSSAAVPTPAQPVTELVSALERFGQGDCAQAVKLLNPVDLPDPEGGASEGNCQAIQGLVDALRSFEPKDSAEYGTGALIEGVSAGKPVAFEAALDDTKNFKLTGGSLRKAQLGTEAASEVNFEAPAAALVKALRDDDCTSAHASVATISRLAYANLKQFCSVFEDNFMSDPSGLGARLQADPSAELIDLGGTRNAHFFGLPTDPVGYRTILVATVGGGDPFVFDVLPVER